MHTVMASSFRKLIVDDTTIMKGLVSTRVYRAHMGERLTTFSSFQKPYVIIEVSIEGSERGIPSQDAMATISYVYDATLTTPQEATELGQKRLIELFDGKHEALSGTGFGLNFRECIKTSTDNYYASDLNAYVGSVTFDCVIEATHINTAEATRKSW